MLSSSQIQLSTPNRWCLFKYKKNVWAMSFLFIYKSPVRRVPPKPPCTILQDSSKQRGQVVVSSDIAVARDNWASSPKLLVIAGARRETSRGRKPRLGTRTHSSARRMEVTETRLGCVSSERPSLCL